MGDGLQRFIAVLAVKSYNGQRDFFIRNHDIFAEDPNMAESNIRSHQKEVMSDLEVVSIGPLKVLTPDEFDLIYKQLPDTIRDISEFEALFSDINPEEKMNKA